MTTVDTVRFAQAFNRLAVATRLPADQTDEAMQRIYWDGLNDLPIDVVEVAAESLAQAGKWFPKLAEWRESAVTLKLRQTIALPPGREEAWAFECATCEDTGWELLRCYPGTGKNCGRRRCMDGLPSAYEHNYTVECSCRPVNRTYQRQRAILRGRAS